MRKRVKPCYIVYTVGQDAAISLEYKLGIMLKVILPLIFLSLSRLS